MTYTIEQLNHASASEARQMLDGLYEHSPWVAEGALHARPFGSVQDLADALVAALDRGNEDAKMTLIRAHPELAGKAAAAGTLTAESTSEQSMVGLNACTPEELARIRQLNHDYQEKFGFPPIICVRGPTGRGLTKHAIIEAFSQRMHNTLEQETAEALHQINLIANLRLKDKFGV